MDRSGIQMICYEFSICPKLKEIINFSYFQYNDFFKLKKRPPPIITDLNQNAYPFSPVTLSSENSNSSKSSNPGSVTFTNNIIHHLLNGSINFFNFDDLEDLEELE